MGKMDEVYRQDSMVVTRRVGDHFIIIPTQQSGDDEETVYSMNDMAAGVWVQIDGTTSLSLIKQKVVEHFDISDGEAEEDLICFIRQLSEAGLIHLVLPEEATQISRG